MRKSVRRFSARERARMPRSVAAAYVVAGGLWIVLSEVLLGAVAGDGPMRGPLAIGFSTAF